MYIGCNTYGQINFVSGIQFGTDKDDVPSNVLSDSLNNVYLFGSTAGLIGKEQHGGEDGLICKYDSNGKILWTKQIGSQFDDKFNNAQFDKNNNICFSGYYGQGEKNKDIWVLKLNPEGDIIWEKTYGTDSADVGENIVIDIDGTIYLTGYTMGNFGGDPQGKSDCIILCLNKNGEQQNIAQFGSTEIDESYGIAIGADSLIYVCGNTFGDLAQTNSGKMDAFWGTFTKELKQKKLVQFGTSAYDGLWLIQTDSKNNITIGGTTGGKIGAQHIGHQDAYLRKMDKEGNLLWDKQFGTEKGDYVNGLVIYNHDDIVISGCQNWSECQGFCRMYNNEGELLWERNYISMGKEHGTCGKGVCINKNGYIYHTGATGGNLFSESKGEHDIYFLKLKLDTEE